MTNNRASENGQGGRGCGGGRDSHDRLRQRIDSNHARDNVGTGILTTGNDVVVRNTSGGNIVNNVTTNYNPASGPLIGPTNTAPNTATSPWANF